MNVPKICLMISKIAQKHTKIYKKKLIKKTKMSEVKMINILIMKQKMNCIRMSLTWKRS